LSVSYLINLSKPAAGLSVAITVSGVRIGGDDPAMGGIALDGGRPIDRRHAYAGI
jgi:hypothetical protein